MRTLARNKVKLWLVTPLTSSPLFDSNGYDTGEFTLNYAIPRFIYISLFPSNTAVTERIFGKDSQLDMISVSNEVELTEDDLLFLTEPLDSFGTTYDYRLTSIKKSINTYNYGFRRRT